MSWTSPRTYVDGEIITAAILNVDIRDNLLVIDTHGHDGTSGDGAATLDSLDEVQWDHAATLGAGAAGHAAMWMVSDGTVHTHNAGGSELTLSDTAHTHTIAEGALNITENHPDNTTGSNTYEELATDTVTPTGAFYTTVHTAIYATIVNGTFSGTGYLRLLKGGVQTVVRSQAITTGGTYGFVATDAYLQPAASSTVFSCEGKADGSGLPFQFQGGGQSLQEIRNQ